MEGGAVKQAANARNQRITINIDLKAKRREFSLYSNSKGSASFIGVQVLAHQLQNNISFTSQSGTDGACCRIYVDTHLVRSTDTEDLP